MAVQHPSAPPRTSFGDPRRVTPSGVIHVKVRYTTRYTVIGNQLAQHGQLSLVAIGLAVHIQSLPDGAKIGIKALADRFPESEHRIAAALRELEEHRYLSRTRERLPNGTVVTRTVSYNHPDAAEPEPDPVPPGDSSPTPAPVPPSPPKEPAPPAAAPVPSPPPPPLPTPQTLDPERHHLAADLLAGLRRDDPRLVLGEREVRRLTPAVAAWLEREVAPEAVHLALTTGLPPLLARPAGFLAHRLTAQLPPPLPALPPGPKAPDPLINCTGCDRSFRSPDPTARCRDCREAAMAATEAA
ncbi:helix-turn-helix domain-containing protein [Streptomyces sp. NPDC047097]|uniref:helix-turn-helix domain-containing protein n=1 Tax=Streptomyces sp. NPDC047097 TaxID=3155260 RepID=UPI0033E385B6